MLGRRSVTWATPPESIFVMGFFKIGSQEVFDRAGF
jgi:hypothetical protein